MEMSKIERRRKLGRKRKREYDGREKRKRAEALQRVLPEVVTQEPSVTEEPRNATETEPTAESTAAGQLVVIESAPPPALPVADVTLALPPHARPRDEHRQGARTNWPLALIAVGTALVGLSINTWFSWTQAPNVMAAGITAALGFVIECGMFFLPDRSAQLFRAGCWFRGSVCGMLLLFAFAFAVNNSIGFASTNVAETTMARAERVTPEVEIAQRAADAATASRMGECTKRGPRCRELEAQEQTKLTELALARAKVSAQADLQAIGAAKLVSWLSRGSLIRSTDDFAMLRLFFGCVLPQLGGLLWLVARR